MSVTHDASTVAVHDRVHPNNKGLTTSVNYLQQQARSQD